MPTNIGHARWLLLSHVCVFDASLCVCVRECPYSSRTLLFACHNFAFFPLSTSRRAFTLFFLRGLFFPHPLPTATTLLVSLAFFSPLRFLLRVCLGFLFSGSTPFLSFFSRFQFFLSKTALIPMTVCLLRTDTVVRQPVKKNRRCKK